MLGGCIWGLGRRGRGIERPMVARVEYGHDVEVEFGARRQSEGGVPRRVLGECFGL